MNGYLLIDKPAGISSFGVVAKVRWLIKETTGQKIKIGHTGTLDPAATGLLILVLGSYTKRASEFSKLDKIYEVELTLGAVSSTGDIEGEISHVSNLQPSAAEIREVLKGFVGEIMQTPPIFSAMKVGGQRAYKLARAGKEVVLEPRPAHIRSLDKIRYEYPELFFTTEVGSGTYIRSLAADIGDRLGTGAYMSALKRTKVGSYDLADSIPLEDANYELLLKNLKT